MRVRNKVVAVAIVAAVATSFTGSRAAQAQGSSLPERSAAPRAPAAPIAKVKLPGLPGQVTARSPAPSPALPAAEHVFTPPAVLGVAWAQALHAVIEGVRHLVDVRELEAQQALRPRVAPPRATPPAPFVPTVRAVWLPGHTVRDAYDKSPGPGRSGGDHAARPGGARHAW